MHASAPRPGRSWLPSAALLACRAAWRHNARTPWLRQLAGKPLRSLRDAARRGQCRGPAAAGAPRTRARGEFSGRRAQGECPRAQRERPPAAAPASTYTAASACSCRNDAATWAARARQPPGWRARRGRLSAAPQRPTCGAGTPRRATRQPGAAGPPGAGGAVRRGGRAARTWSVTGPSTARATAAALPSPSAMSTMLRACRG